MQKKAAMVRDPWLDNAKGILIMLVVIGHLTAPLVKYSPSTEIIYKIINSFHMPCFLIVSGYLAKRRINSRDYGSVISSLLLPYLSAQFIVYVSAAFVEKGLKQIPYQTVSSLNFLRPNYHLWFLCAMIIYSLVTPPLKDRFAKHPMRLMGISILLSLLSGFCPEVSFLKLTKCITSYPFFLFGYYMSREQLQELKERKFLKWISAAIVLIWLAAMVRYHEQIIGIVFTMVTQYAKYPRAFQGIYPVVSRAVLIAASIPVSLAFLVLTPKKHTVFTALGRNSMIVYVLHGCFVIWIQTWDQYTSPIYQNLNTPLRKAGFFLFCVVLTFALASPPVVKVFRKILQPELDWKKALRSLFRDEVGGVIHGEQDTDRLD